MVFEEATVRDRAPYDKPHPYPAGLTSVLVTGVAVVPPGAHTQARPGQIVRAAR